MSVIVQFIVKAPDVDRFVAASEKYGDRFNEEAGTAGLDWTTHIWHRKAGA